MNNNDQRLLYSTKTLMAACSFTRSALYVALNDGSFPLPFKIGSKNYWYGEEVHAWVNEAAKRERGLADPTWRR